MTVGTDVHDVTGPPMDPIPRDAHLLRPLMDWAVREPGRLSAAYRDGDRFVDVTAAELYECCRALAKGFIASGLEPGERVALMSRTPSPGVDARRLRHPRCGRGYRPDLRDVVGRADPVGGE